MSRDQDDLSSITREILVPGGALIDLLSQAHALRNLFEALAPLRIDPQRDRVRLGPVFKLDADSIYGWQGCEGDRLPAGRVRIPNLLDNRYRPHLLTRIAVYGDNVLRDYDCSLTTPRPLPKHPPLVGGETLQFQYGLGRHPEPVYEVLD